MRFNILGIAFIPFIMCFYEGKASFSRLTARNTTKNTPPFFTGTISSSDRWLDAYTCCSFLTAEDFLKLWYKN